MKKWIRRTVEFYRTLRARAAAAERDCKHDGSEPMCADCTRQTVGW